jgi:hypothetical protein
MKVKFYLWTFLVLLHTTLSNSQDTSTYKLRLSVPVFEYPQNISSPGYYPSMNQALEWSNDLYELSFWGIDELGDWIFISDTKPNVKWRKYSNYAFKYLSSLAFSRYASELPIPLGVWGHEEFHRTVLGVNDISSKNGNWLLNRWDGTVYGVSDYTLEDLKSSDLNNLLYSYVAGVQYEILLNEKSTLDDFYKKRSMSKTALILYNAYYVFDYFRFATGPLSDSVKILAPPNESTNPTERDFAGADLTAWAFDMFNPVLAFTARDPFPDGEGVNRRIGYSDLSEEAQDYLSKQKQLSLLNFLNPAIFFINRIKINQELSFNFFTQYSPTHFGNDIAFYLPVKYRKYDLLVNVHRYANKTNNGFGIGMGLYNLKFSEKIQSDFTLNFWNQPESFFKDETLPGGLLAIKTKYSFAYNLSCFVLLSGKSRGWTLGNPYLNSNATLQLGIAYDLVE